jgi:hypothetical protein
MASDDIGFTDEPARRRRRRDGDLAGDEPDRTGEPPQPARDSGAGNADAAGSEEIVGGYEMAPLPPEEAVEEKAKKVGQETRRKRSRSILQADEVPHPFTIRQGWLDGLFASTFLPMTLAFCFFFFPLMLPVAVAAAIIAHDAEARRNALLTIGFCFLPLLLLCCVCGISGALNPVLGR